MNRDLGAHNMVIMDWFLGYLGNEDNEKADLQAKRELKEPLVGPDGK